MLYQKMKSSLVFLLALPLAGCNIIAATAVVFGGGAREPAVYDLPKQSRVVVVVDDYHGLAYIPEFISTTESEAIRMLDAEGPSHLELVPAADVRAAVASLGDAWHGTNETEPVSILTFGRLFDADIVIYANLTSYMLREVDTFFSPQASYDVVVYDCHTGECLLPGGGREQLIDTDRYHGANYALNVALVRRDMSAYGESADTRARSKLAAVSGLRLAHLFYKHEELEQAQLLY